MSNDDKKAYIEGVPNPDKLGFITTTYMGHEFGVFDKSIEEFCKYSCRNKSHVDKHGFEYEVIAAAKHSEDIWGFLECKAKDDKGMVDITFTVYLSKQNKVVHSWEIESYNPYFGCDVSYIKWRSDSLVVIYEEKHDTYLAVVSLDATDKFKVIEYKWCLSNDTVYYRGYKETVVKQVVIPSLITKNDIALEQAKALKFLPKEMYTDA